MQSTLKKTSSLLLSILIISSMSLSAMAQSFNLSSNDITHGEFMDSQQAFNGFGCTGSDQSPHLKWSNPPKGTKSFAITAYDPDAPTGSGWWHWQVINIPLTVLELNNNAGDKNNKKLKQIENDYGVKGFGGACPPAGHGAHRYQFTVHALSLSVLEVPDDASGALTGYMINANTIESKTIEALYKR
ncbi:MAG: YbhB/YbcL family Raf kinase inhibitor-like protein [Saccharospirillaceae bacterium]|nr:YbhB/YbcL family Raf kinase inhibitor-like protein [Pseudomonadales bacterium]NRB77567.1 YbhB/YbcL family Raf kinase inhibitor-like protein [Saccharospirillaceae bacterium]